MLKEEKIETFHQDEEKKEIIQFNLNKKNKNIYYDILFENNIQIEAEFIRKMIYRYTYQSKSSRELFLYRDIVDRLKYSIKIEES